MSGVRLTDEEIQAMTPDERHELILRLAPHPPDVMPTAQMWDRIRRWRSGLMLASAAVLIPWTVYLANTLPSRYVARHWVATWVGFDIILLSMLTATAVFGWRRRQLLFPTAFASGVLLICDAWFDVLTSHPGKDFLQALGSALLVELPLAFVLIAGPLRLMGYVAIRHGLVHPGTRVWQMEIPLPELWPRGSRLPS